MDKNKLSSLTLLIVLLISTIFSLAYVCRVLYWQRNTFESNGLSIDQNLRQNMSHTYHARNGMVIMELFLLILLCGSIVLMGYSRQIIHKQAHQYIGGVMAGVLVLLVLFACLSFVGPGNEGYWMQQSIVFRRESSLTMGNTKQRLDEFNTFFKNIPVVILTAGLLGMPAVFTLFAARLKE